jgi:alkylmercury lyase
MKVLDLDEPIEAAAFRQLLRTQAPVTTAALAAALGAQEVAIGQAVAALAHRGHVRLADGGDVVGAAGLSIVRSRHELVIEGRQFWTWCAWDAVGILAALRAAGVVRSRDPQSGRDLEVAFTGGSPETSPAVIFMVELTTFTSAHDEWCPLVNLFETEASARSWIAARGLSGSVLTVAEAAERGARRWGPLVPTPPAP